METFPEFQVIYQRLIANDQGAVLSGKFRTGRRDYLLGCHRIFYSLMCVYRVFDKLNFLGSLARIFGYLLAGFLRTKRELPSEVVRYLRREQIDRLKALFDDKDRSNAIKSSCTLNLLNEELGSRFRYSRD